MAPTLRRATAGDADPIRDLVHDAYVDYTPLLGRTPIPMLADYHVAVRAHDVWVLDDGDAGIVGVIELIAHPDHLYVENVAIAQPARARVLAGGCCGSLSRKPGSVACPPSGC